MEFPFHVRFHFEIMEDMMQVYRDTPAKTNDGTPKLVVVMCEPFVFLSSEQDDKGYPNVCLYQIYEMILG